MALPVFDTLKFVKRLREGGFSEPQAESMTEAQGVVFQEVLDSTIATKTDIIKLEGDISRLELEIFSVGTELKAEIAKIDSKLEQVSTKSEERFKLLNWMVGFTLTFNVAILLKLFLAH